MGKSETGSPNIAFKLFTVVLAASAVMRTAGGKEATISGGGDVSTDAGCSTTFLHLKERRCIFPVRSDEHTRMCNVTDVGHTARKYAMKNGNCSASVDYTLARTPVSDSVKVRVDEGCGFAALDNGAKPGTAILGRSLTVTLYNAPQPKKFVSRGR